MKLHTSAHPRSQIRPADGSIISNPLDMRSMSLDATAGAEPSQQLDHTYTDWMRDPMPTLPDPHPVYGAEPVIANHAPVASVDPTEQIRNVEPPRK